MTITGSAVKTIMAAIFLSFGIALASPTYSVQQFATGAAVGGTSPDSVSVGDGSVWIAYTNGANSAGASGSSTVVRYGLNESVQNTWMISGNVDGLKVDPTSGLVWALQNNDGNSAVTIINPGTNATTALSYGSTYTNRANRGFDDVVFAGGQIYLSETNPASATDPVVLRLTSGVSSPLQLTSILAAGAITDPDSLKLTTGGSLVLTGEANQSLTFIQNPGSVTQTETVLALKGTNGQTITGSPDDTIFPDTTGGFFYIADTGANKIDQVAAIGLAAGSVYIDAGDEFGILNTATGVVTPILTGTSPHGADFISFAAAGIPEPATIAYSTLGLLLCVGGFYRRRKRQG